MSIGATQIILIILIVVLLFGRGKISEIMGDFAKGLRSFKKGLTEDEIEAGNPPKTIETSADQATEAKSENRD